MNPVRHVLERFELTNRRHRLIRKGDCLLLAVSGGPDSMALLGILLLLRKKYELKLYAAHLDHGLQRTAGRVTAVAQKTCLKNNVPFYSKKTDVRSLASRAKLSLEDAGRRARYDLLTDIAKRTKAKIVTAHSMDDQSETVLMRVLRGSGVRGLAGIPYERKERGVTLIRPLLDVRKSELVSLANSLKMPFVLDPMNRDVKFLRSRVRHDLLPSLRRYNPRIDEALSDLQAVHADLRRYLEGPLAAKYRTVVSRASKNALRLKASALKKMHPALRNETLFEALARLKGDIAGFGYAHIRSISELLDKRVGETHLPHRIHAAKKGPFLHLRIRK